MARAEKEQEGEEKVTRMILEVDLKCHFCYKKVKKLLSKFPQIRDQVFDEDKNKVMITVVCCDPERIRDKLCCKGGKAIQTIEILDDKPPPPPPPSKPKEPTKNQPPPEKPKLPSPPPPAPKPDPPPKVDPPPKPNPPSKPTPMPPPSVSKPEPVKMPDPIPAPPPPQPKPQPQPQPQPQPGPVRMPYPMDGYPQPFCPPVSVCCQECYEGRDGGPCHYGYGRPVPPPPGPCYNTYGYPNPWNRPCCVTRCGDYFSEENPQGCSIM